MRDMYLVLNGEGYETWIARSRDLLHWEPEGRILAQREYGWDCLQADGGLCLLNPQWGRGTGCPKI